MSETKIELHERKFCFTGKNLSNVIIEDFKAETKNGEIKDIEFNSLFQSVTAFYRKENEIQIVGYSILEHITAEDINKHFSFSIVSVDGGSVEVLKFSELKLPFIIFNDQDATEWQIQLMKIALTEKKAEEIIEEVKEEEEEKEEVEPDGLSISFSEGKQPIVYEVLNGEKREYRLDGEIGDTMTFSHEDHVVEYDKETEELTKVN